MTSPVEEPTTVRFFRGQRRAFDALARRRGIRRSELLRQAIAAVLAAEQSDDVDGAIDGRRSAPRRSTCLPCVREDDGERAREALSTRNLASLTGVCPGCGAKGKVEAPEFMRRILPSTPQRVIASLSRPTRSGTITTTTSVSNGSSVSRATTILRFDHRTGCPALGANIRKLSA